MSPALRVTRVTLARAFSVHPDTILAWHAEGLNAAIVQRGGPGRPATYDPQRALDWYNGHKAKPAPACFQIKSPADMQTAALAVGDRPKSAALKTAMQLFDAATTNLTKKGTR